MTESAIRSSAPAWIRTYEGPAPEELLEAMVRFEQRYGGLRYRVLGGNHMEYGLDGLPIVRHGPLGLAFTGVLDGDWTWDLDVLLDGRTAMEPGQWPYRVIDRSVDQRIERHALLAEVEVWFHRTFECSTPSGVLPITHEESLPPPVLDAAGPAESWWYDRDVAVQAQLTGWPAERDRWTVRYFARTPQLAAAANPTVYAAVGHETVPATWCTICSRAVSPGKTCTR